MQDGYKGQVLLLICPVHFFLSNSAWEVDLVDVFVYKNSDFFSHTSQNKNALTAFKVVFKKSVQSTEIYISKIEH